MFQSEGLKMAPAGGYLGLPLPMVDAFMSTDPDVALSVPVAVPFCMRSKVRAPGGIVVVNRFTKNALVPFVMLNVLGP